MSSVLNHGAWPSLITNKLIFLFFFFPRTTFNAITNMGNGNMRLSVLYQKQFSLLFFFLRNKSKKQLLMIIQENLNWMRIEHIPFVQLQFLRILLSSFIYGRQKSSTCNVLKTFTNDMDCANIFSTTTSEPKKESSGQYMHNLRWYHLIFAVACKQSSFPFVDLASCCLA